LFSRTVSRFGIAKVSAVFYFTKIWRKNFSVFFPVGFVYCFDDAFSRHAAAARREKLAFAFFKLL